MGPAGPARSMVGRSQEKQKCGTIFGTKKVLVTFHLVEPYVRRRDAELLDRTARGLFIFAGKDKARWWVDPRKDGDTGRETARLRISSIASMDAH
jgi:hypothetical protein